MSDVDRYQYGYDQNSNRLYKANIVGTAAVGQLDEGYGYDKLNRLTRMQRGTLSGGVIASTPAREMDYTLDPTGNWSGYLTATNGTTDLSQGRSSNSVNEITAITAAIGSAWVTPTYDPAGNTVIMPQVTDPTQSFIAQYDAWNRMVSINTSSGSVASYQYDGRGRRITKYTASSSETRHFYYTNSWQDIEERTGTSTVMDKQYVWGVRYVDELICRDDATPERLYAMQDANFNLTGICNSSGGVVERYLFDPYGNRAIMNGSWGAISASAYNWSIGHQGLMHDVESGLVYNRYRLLHPIVGSMSQREPYGSKYIDTVNLYEYELSSPVFNLDSRGLQTRTGPSTAPSTQPTSDDTTLDIDNISEPEYKTIAAKMSKKLIDLLSKKLDDVAQNLAAGVKTLVSSKNNKCKGSGKMELYPIAIDVVFSQKYDFAGFSVVYTFNNIDHQLFDATPNITLKVSGTIVALLYCCPCDKAGSTPRLELLAIRKPNVGIEATFTLSNFGTLQQFKGVFKNFSKDLPPITASIINGDKAKDLLLFYQKADCSGGSTTKPSSGPTTHP
jgi:RHS repeat-associated protein